MINDNIKSLIKEHSIKEFPNEACGLIVLDKKLGLMAIPCKNIHGNPINYFTVDSNDYISASALGKIVGCYHSHKELSIFSPFDIQNCSLQKIVYIMYNIKEDKFNEIYPEGESEILKYIGRKFEIGVSDCLSLATDFYKKEFGIEIRNYPRGENWHKERPSYFRDLWKEEGFKRIPSKDMKEYDILLVRYIGDEPSHIVIYLGNDFILHQPRNEYSRIEKLSEQVKSRIIYVLRHGKFS